MSFQEYCYKEISKHNLSNSDIGLKMFSNFTNVGDLECYERKYIALTSVLYFYKSRAHCFDLE